MPPAHFGHGGLPSRPHLDDPRPRRQLPGGSVTLVFILGIGTVAIVFVAAAVAVGLEGKDG